MKIHVLSGDSLVEPFRKTEIEGEIVVCRECLIDGELRAESLAEFWQMRDNYLSLTFEKPNNFYQEYVKGEFDKLLEKASGNEINLWFEYELFCQVNLWFCLSLLNDKTEDIFIIYPFIKDERDIWKGFGYLTEDELKQSFEQRIKLDKKDIQLGEKLWEAFRNKDHQSLKKLGEIDSGAFPKLNEICQAAIELEIRPKKVLQEIILKQGKDFGKVFQKFNQTEDIYGFGDLQVKKIYDEMILK